MRKVILLTILCLLFAEIVSARSFGPGASNKAKHIKTDTSLYDNNLFDSDGTLQHELNLLDDLKAASMPCVTTDDWCYIYESNVLKLYVNNSLQAQWPSVATFDHLLLESGDFLLLESGDKVRLE